MEPVARVPLRSVARTQPAVAATSGAVSPTWPMMRIAAEPGLASGLDPIAQRFAGKRLVLVTTHTQARFVLPPAIAQIKRDFPQVSVHLQQAPESQALDLLTQGDADMARVVAEHGVPAVLMHNRREVDPTLDILREVDDFFARSLDIAARAGVARDRIVLDPGIGFGKTPAQSMTALARLGELQSFGLPMLVGASRKRFISTVTPSEPHQRLGGSIAAHLVAAQNGTKIIRAHDVAETVQALRVAAAIRGQG